MAGINLRYKLSDKEIDILLKNMVIIIDSREKDHLATSKYLAEKKVKTRIEKLDFGDYSAAIESNEQTIPLGVHRDLYLGTYVEKKKDADELCGNLSKANASAFTNELTRMQGSKFVLFVTDENFDYNIATGNYRSKYDPKALKGRLESLKAKFNFEIVPMPVQMFGHNMYYRFYYQARHMLKTCIY